MRTGRVLLPVLALAAMLILAGCGGEDDSSESATSGTTNGSAEAERGSGEGQGEGEAGKSEKKGDGQGEPANGGSSEGGQGEGRSNAPQPEGEREPGITPEQRSKATTASLTLDSPVVQAQTPIAAKYTCDGADTSPPLKWTGVPPEAAELVLFALNFRPVNRALFFDWAVAGIDPEESEFKEGSVPAGAVVGKNSFGERGYGLCPPEAGKAENYIFMLYAIPEALDPEPGFDPLALREEVVAQSGNVGLLGTSYERK